MNCVPQSSYSPIVDRTYGFCTNVNHVIFVITVFVVVRFTVIVFNIYRSMFSIGAKKTSHHYLQQKEKVNQCKEKNLDNNNHLKGFLVPRQESEVNKHKENHNFRWFREHYSSPNGNSKEITSSLYNNDKRKSQQARQFDAGEMQGAVPVQQARERLNDTVKVNGSKDQSLLMVVLEAFDLPSWSSLTWVERMLLPLAVILAPFLVYYTENWCILVASTLTTMPILGSELLSGASKAWINTRLLLSHCMASFISFMIKFFQHELDRSVNEKVVILVLAALIIIVFDADPIVNNERLLRLCRSISVIDTPGNAGSKFKYNKNNNSKNAASSSIYFSVSFFIEGYHLLHSSWSQFPRVGKWGIVFLVLSAAMRVTVYCTAAHVTATFAFIYPWLRSGALILIGCFSLFQIVSWKLSQRASWFRAVEQIGGVAKLVLAKHGRAYPIEYIKEEIAELILQFRRPSTTYFESAKLLLSPLSTLSKTSRSAKVMGGTNILGTKDCDITAGEMSSANSMDESQGIAAYMETVDLNTYSLQKLWPAVVQWVQTDRRIQRLDLMVDGSRQACWRILSGKTAAWF